MKRLVVLTIVLMLITGMVYAASSSTAHDVTMQVTEVVLIALNSTATITLSTSAPASAGEDPVGSTDNTKVLRYTSLVPSLQTRRITANWAVGNVAPAGTSLRLVATSVAAGCGAPQPQIILSDTGQDIVAGIGSCRTTLVDGAALLYTFSIDNVGNLVVGETRTVTVTFTLTDAS